MMRPAGSHMRLVVGFSKGSASDHLARALAPCLERRLAEPVVIERVKGDDGAKAAALVAGSTPDGKTLFIATLGTHAITPLVRRLYDPVRDFSPISLLVEGPLVVASSRASGLDSIAALMSAAKAGKQPTFGCSAVAGAPRLAGELFNHLTGGRLRPVAYEETRSLYDDLVSGRLDLTFNNISSVLPLARAGQINALAVTSAAPSPTAPDLSTVCGSGLAAYEVTNWLGLVGPKHMARAKIEEIQQAVASTATELADEMRQAGLEITASSPAVFRGLIRHEMDRWEPIAARFVAAGSRQDPAVSGAEEHP